MIGKRGYNQILCFSPPSKEEFEGLLVSPLRGDLEGLTTLPDYSMMDLSGSRCCNADRDSLCVQALDE